MTDTRIRNLDIATMRSFVTIAEAGSMKRAASRLYLTQSAISMQIKRMETSLGTNVFDRSSHGMELTPKGEQLLHYARQILELNDDVWRKLTSPDYAGEIRLGVPSDVIYPYIPAILKEFSRHYPRMQIKLSTAVSKTLKQQFDEGLLDVILTTEQKPQTSGEILNTQSLVWVGAKQGNAHKQRPVPLGQSRKCAFRPVTIAALENAGIEWIDVVTTDDELVPTAMTSADLCICTLLEFSENTGDQERIDHNGQLPDLPSFSIVMYHTDISLNPMIEILTRMLKDIYTLQPKVKPVANQYDKKIAIL